MMDSPLIQAVDDEDLDDAALWAVIDSAAAASTSYSSAAAGKPRTKPLTPIPFPLPSPQTKLPTGSWNQRHCYANSSDGEVVQNNRPHKISRTTSSPQVSELSSPHLVMVKHNKRPSETPPAQRTSSPDMRNFEVMSYRSPSTSGVSCEQLDRHCLAAQFPSVSLFKEYQNAAMAILEKSDYTMISGNTYIKKSGWRKISFYFNLSYEIKDKIIEFDENHNVQRAEFIVRAYMQGGRFSDGWGSCERREKKFMKPNHDIPCTAETRAKNRACQDLLGIGEYRPGSKHAPRT